MFLSCVTDWYVPAHVTDWFVLQKLFSGRCGQRAAYIPHPYSNLASSITRGVLRAVHAGRHNCQCSLDLASTNPHSAMYGDQPESPGYSITQNSLGLNCPQNDMMCRRYLRNYRRNRVDPMMRTRQNHISNRSRLRSLQVNGGSQQGRGHRGHGRRRHQRHLVGSHRIRNGMTAWNCANVTLTPVIRVPTHRCRCPNSNSAEECICTRPIYGRAGDILSWHCGCHNPTPETRAQCDHCHVCDNRPVCREVTRLAAWQEQCRCQQVRGSSQASTSTWQWQNVDGTATDWQGTSQTWQISSSGNWQWNNMAGVMTSWQWHNSAGEVVTPWQWSNSNISTTDWQHQQTNTPWQTNLSGIWQWQSLVNAISTNWQWQSSVSAISNCWWQTEGGTRTHW